MATDAAVTVRNLRKCYGDTVAVDDVDFDVAEGEVLGILGPNGAGKTTTVECIAGLREPDGGEVRVFGIEPYADRPALTKIMGIQLQQSRMQPKITVREVLEEWSAFYADPVPWAELAARLGLADLLDKRFRTLSGGQQQRLSIALGLIGRPKVVVLDELSTGLDPRARREVWSVVRDVRTAGTTVLLVTHAMDEAQELCDRIAIFRGGRLTALDSPDGLVAASGSATITSFRPSTAIDLESLRQLAGINKVRTDAGRVVVTHGGGGNTTLTLMAEIQRQQVVPHDLRVEPGTLDSAYLDLTADEPESEPQSQEPR